MLQPREVAFLQMFPPTRRDRTDAPGVDSSRRAALKDTHQTLVAELKIEQAQAGAWTGKLVTGETSGAVAAGKPQPSGR